VESGLISRDQSGRLFDRFRRRITFRHRERIRKVVAFGCRALGDDLPISELARNAIYSKSNVLYYMDRAKDAIRRQDSPSSWKATWTRSRLPARESTTWWPVAAPVLAEPQIKLLGRFTKRVIVNYDPDAAGQAATERSISLLSSGFRGARAGAPGDWRQESRSRFVHSREGRGGYIKALKESPPYVIT